MLKIFSGRNAVREISKNCFTIIRKYGSRGPKLEYECAHKKSSSACKCLKDPKIHPFLKEVCGIEKSRFWKLLFWGGCVPCLLLTCLIVSQTSTEQKRPPFLEYRHLRIRNKSLPWGDGNKSLFHNPRKNALPNGYEVEEDEE